MAASLPFHGAPGRCDAPDTKRPALRDDIAEVLRLCQDLLREPAFGRVLAVLVSENHERRRTNFVDSATFHASAENGEGH